MNLDAHRPCQLCRQPLRSGAPSATSPTLIQLPPPNEQFMVERLRYRCGDCLETFDLEAARAHPSACDKKQRQQPPDYIQPLLQPLAGSREVVSNPTIFPANHPDHRDALFIIHANGRQVGAKFFRRNEPVADFMAEIANKIGCPADEIKLYKFLHREVARSTSVGDVANREGATYLSAFRNLEPLGDKTLQLLLETVGPPPLVTPPRPPNERRRRRRSPRQPFNPID